MQSCSNCIEIDNHVFGLYTVVGFLNQSPCQFDGYWSGVVYIRQTTDMSQNYPNNIKTTDCINNQINLSIKEDALKNCVLVTEELKDYLFKAFLDKKPILLELIKLEKEIPSSFEGISHKISICAVQAILPYDKPIVSMTVKRESIQ